jgi:hypothetical protein
LVERKADYVFTNIYNLCRVEGASNGAIAPDPYADMAADQRTALAESSSVSYTLS